MVCESGPGKTTVARMILGLLAPRQGSVRVERIDLGHRRGRVVVQFAPRSYTLRYSRLRRTCLPA
jgi:ABC-type oligopeptide transport system ATPase subunit